VLSIVTPDTYNLEMTSRVLENMWSHVSGDSMCIRIQFKAQILCHTTLQSLKYSISFIHTIACHHTSIIQFLDFNLIYLPKCEFFLCTLYKDTDSVSSRLLLLLLMLLLLVTTIFINLILSFAHTALMYIFQMVHEICVTIISDNRTPRVQKNSYQNPPPQNSARFIHLKTHFPKEDVIYPPSPS
jgi:hypothetical protein